MKGYELKMYNYITFNNDNVEVMREYKGIREFDLIYGDMIYENTDFSWIIAAEGILKENGIFIIQTDYHTVANVKLLLDELGLTFVNWAIYLNEWGGTSKRFFPRKHDDILIYAKGKDYKFYPDRIQIPKKTAGTAFDKKGTGMKTPCDVFYDLGNFSTVANERVKVDGKNIQWQKPLKLMERLLLPFTDEKDCVLDPFMGSGSTGVWCLLNKRNFVGIESDPKVFMLANDRLRKASNETKDKIFAAY